jgi:hypothetical protein
MPINYDALEVRSDGWIKLFYLLLFIYVMSVPTSGVLGWMGYPMGYHLFKVSFVSLFIFFSIFVMLRGGGNSYWVLAIVISCSSSFFMSMLSFSDINIHFYLSHLYFYFVAAFGLAAGGVFYTRYGVYVLSSDKFYKRTSRLLLLFFIIYYCLYFYGAIPYWGLSSVVPLLLPFFLVNKQHTYVFCLLLVVILSGKRSILLITLMQFLLYYLLFGSVKWLKLFMPAVLIFALFTLWLLYPDFFIRFQGIVASDLSFGERVALLSSGRTDEILIFWNYFSNNPHTLIFGDGLGANLIVEYFNGTVRTLHYSHFSPFGLLLLGGIPLAIICYFPIFFMITKLLYRSHRSKGKHFFWGFLVLFYLAVVSLIGPAMFNDIIFWFYLGFIYKITNTNEKEYE